VTTKPVQVSTLKKGNYCVIEGDACTVVNVEISRPGKHGHAKVRLTAVGLIDDKKRVVVMPGHDNMDVPIVDKRTAQILAVTGESANVMDAETYETFDMRIPEEMKGQVATGDSVVYWTILDDKVMKQVRPA